ncbi:MAG: site-specific integrase [Finegoldia sp.]|nr:site-specific integrase [Finegoldia sp.]
MQITEYHTNKGEKRYELRAYLGIKDGKKIQIHKRNLRTKADAKAIYTDALYKFNNGQTMYKTDMTYKELYNIWLDLYRKNVKEQTLLMTKTNFRLYILPVFANKKIKDIRPYDCQQFINSLEDKVAGRSIYNYAKSCMNYAYTIDLIPSNPFDKVIYPKFKSIKKHTDFLVKDQVKTLLDNIDDLEHLLIFRMLIYLGLRKGELLALHWDNINLKEKTLDIKYTLSRDEFCKIIRTSPKTKNSIATLSLDDETVRLLKHYKRFINSIIVFPNTKGDYMNPSNLNILLKKYLKKAGLPDIRVHDLRHTTASLLFASGASMKEVQSILRHSNIQTTMNIYAHISEDNKKETMTNFAKYLES